MVTKPDQILIGTHYNDATRQYEVTVVTVIGETYKGSPLRQPAYGAGGKRIAIEGSYFATRAEADIIADEVAAAWHKSAIRLHGEVADWAARFPNRPAGTAPYRVR